MSNVIKRKTVTFDASGQVVGRLATQIAVVLIGKHRPDYQPHIDSGDKVVVLNPGAVKFTGKKMEVKEYKHHSMHPGGLKIKTAKKLTIENPEKIISHAVSRMLPKNKLRINRLQRLSFK